jgi:short-subunit dehydrogenase
MLCTIFTVIVLALVAYQVFYYFMIWKACKPQFEDKTVLITGGSSGLGEEMAKRFVAFGAKKVIIASRGVKERERVKSACADPSTVEILQMDLSKPDECLAQAQRIKGIDILINNGGISMREEFVNTEYSTCEYMMNTNCLSHIALTKGLLFDMISRGQCQIVNILSISGLLGVPVRTLYCASKFAMDGFGKSLRQEVKKHSITVT